MIWFWKLVLITMWLWFRFVHESVKASHIKSLMAQIHSKKLSKKWVKSVMKMKNKLLQKKIDYVKFKNESLLNAEKDFFDIFFKITDLSDAETLQYLLIDFSKLCCLLLNI